MIKLYSVAKPKTNDTDKLVKQLEEFDIVDLPKSE